MSYFEPIIGSNFDSLAAQRQYWGGLNNQTATGNVNRATAAQEMANNYFQQLAASRQAAINRQAEMDWLGQQANVQQQAAAEDRATRAEQFKVNTQLAKDDIARRDKQTERQIEKQDEATKERAREFDTGMQQQQKLAEDDLNNTGQALASTFAASQRQVNQAEKLASDLQSEHDDLTSEVAELAKKSDKTPEDLQKMSDDNARLVVLKKILPKAIASQDRLNQRHLALSDNITARGFVTDEDKGSLTHLQTGKTWSFANALKKATESIPSSSGTGTNDYFGGGGGSTQTVTNGAPVARGMKTIQEQKADYANGIAAQHPDWPRARIIAETQKAFTSGAVAQPSYF